MNHTPVFVEIFRPAPRPSTEMPFGARSVGRYRVLPPFRGSVCAKPFFQLFWGIEGTGIMVFDGVPHVFGPRQIGIYLPGMTHEWYAKGGPWEFRWFTADGPLVAPLAMAFGLAAGIHAAGAAPVRLFERLHATLRDPSLRGELDAGALAYRLLTQASSLHHGLPDGTVSAAIKRIHTAWMQRDFNVKTLAADLRVHRSGLSRRFKAATGLAPSEYAARLRIQHALSLLHHTALPIGEVARQCGFADQAYLTRVIRRLTQRTPLQVRASSRLMPDTSNLKTRVQLLRSCD